MPQPIQNATIAQTLESIAGQRRPAHVAADPLQPRTIARADGNAARLAHRNAAAKEEAGILATAREESEKLSVAGRAANNVALDHAKKGLEAQAKELASLVASKALGREVGQ